MNTKLRIFLFGGDKDWLIGRVENSKMFQNQMAQCFFIGFYDIETGHDFYFFQKSFFDGWKWIFLKNQFLQGKNGQNKPENHQN